MRAAAPKAAPYKLWDRRGLYLLVSPSGGRWWRFDYRVGGTRKTISLGTYPAVTLRKARAKAQAARQQIAEGHDPAAAKRAAALAQRASESVATVAAEWWTKHATGLRPRTRTKKRWVLDRYLLPALGERPIRSIEPPDVLAAAGALERRGRHESARYLVAVAGQILRYAVATGRATRDATADLRGALTAPTVRHFAALTEPAKIGALLRDCDAYDGAVQVRTALRLAPLLFLRPVELQRGRWCEIDFEAAMWKIPAERTKTKRDLLVPLATQAVTLLRELRALRLPGPYLFPGRRSSGRPISENTLNAALRYLGYGPDAMTAHGFRAIARTLLDEVLGEDRVLIEVQLGHVVPGPLGATYNRSLYLDQRTKMMQRWADYLDRLRAMPSAASST